ncbi:MAG: hypothetical protein IJ066_09580, partial [Bacteroidaceae bacterium]|nr:hypothetical protein [Bacteroidaceae bacterium]
MNNFTLNHRTCMRSLLRVVCLLVTCCCSAVAWALSEVHVEKAGTLSSLLPASEEQLKISGSINGSDIKYLRQLINEGGVTSVDLTAVKIVRGGAAYYETNKTENDVIGPYMFRECSKLREIFL